MSLPLWERGLKYCLECTHVPQADVAPLVGAWIEIASRHLWNLEMWSLPLWERGLKSRESVRISCGVRSLPLWERGLKCRFRFLYRLLQPVAPLVGAWIEIAEIRFFPYRIVASLPLWERGLKYLALRVLKATFLCRSPCGSVD